MPCLSRWLVLTAVWLLVLRGAIPVRGQDDLPGELTVRLASGREFTAAVDSRTSDQHLVLRFARGRATVRRPIEWNRVVAATYQGGTVDLADLRTLAERIKTEAAPVPAAIAGPELPVSPPKAATPPRVTTVTFDAHLANWDGDVETDGLVVDVAPLSADGQLVVATGTVEIELHALPTRQPHDTPHAGESAVVLVERWTRSLRPADFAAGGARLKLPFGQIHPEFDTSLLAHGLVHLRLTVAGDGVFDSTQDAVRLRPWSPTRDQLQQQSHPRFLPNERLGRR
ncbi:MAG: hypothetical protein SFU86_11370 [Pirellulaceae bacterium]|nr:hypothetical protein [Pirellulaceae bacterium]